MGNEKERNDIGTMSDPESKLSRKRSQKEFEELLLKDVLIELEAGDGEYWEQKAMELAGEPGYTPTTQQRAAFEERLDLEVKRIQKQKRQIAQISHRSQTTDSPLIAEDQQESQDQKVLQISAKHPGRSRRILRKAGSVAAVLILFLFMTMYHTVDAFAAGVDRFVVTMLPDDGAEELRIEEKQGGGLELNMEDYVGMYMPDWIPRGYVLSKIESLQRLVRIEYINNDGKIISYQISDGKHSWMVDDEAVAENKVYVLDTWARVIEMDGSVCVVWEKSKYVYTVVGSVDLRDDLIKMVEKCIKIE